MEGGLMSFLVKGAQGWSWLFHLHTFSAFSSSARVIEDAEEKQAVLLKNYLDYVHNKFNKYAFCFFFCELLNICISISQVEQNNNKNNSSRDNKVEQMCGKITF